MEYFIQASIIFWFIYYAIIEIRFNREKSEMDDSMLIISERYTAQNFLILIILGWYILLK